MEHTPLLLLFGLLVWFWVDSLRTRERAVILAKRRCREQGFQLLDQSVSLQHLGLSWTRQGVRIKRLYRFEFSESGTERLLGHIRFLGARPMDFSFGLPTADQPGNRLE